MPLESVSGWTAVDTNGTALLEGTLNTYREQPNEVPTFSIEGIFPQLENCKFYRFPDLDRKSLSRFIENAHSSYKITPGLKEVNISYCPLCVPDSAKQEFLSKRYSLHHQVNLKAALIFLRMATAALDLHYRKVYLWRDKTTIHAEVQKSLKKIRWLSLGDLKGGKHFLCWLWIVLRQYYTLLMEHI